MKRKKNQMNLWTNKDISKILIQLDTMGLPFAKYSLCHDDGELKVLGHGGSAEVFEAKKRKSHKADYAMKVIGFGNPNTDSDMFNEAVEVQSFLGYTYDNVIKVYDYSEIWVTLDDKDNVVDVALEKPDIIIIRTMVKLQFVLMERATSVITRTKGGNIKMTPWQLAYGDEKEILKLAYDIGLALKAAHDKNVLHRDVKLENVFYSEKKKCYKLGDFGIAKKTEDGFAGTIAFTKGYAAPEVRASKDRYDNTADIYSFGIMLYVLCNGVKFPESNTYNVNANIQYIPGYVIPYPEKPISEELYQIIKKACMYDADLRYQSMEAMLIDIEKLVYKGTLSYKREHKNSALLIGTIMLAIGVASWKLIIAPDKIVSLTAWEYLFMMCCLGKGILKILNKNRTLISIGILGIGTYLLIASGFSWSGLLLLVWMILSPGISSGYLAGSVLITNAVYLLQCISDANVRTYEEYGWLVVTSISIAAVLIMQYFILTVGDRKIVNAMYFKRGWYWAVVCIMYAVLILVGFMNNPVSEKIYRRILGNIIVDLFKTYDIKMVGIYGLGFCILWILREHFMMANQKRLRKRIWRQQWEYENEYHE